MASDTPPERATPANWREAPFNRWAFRNVREILPTAVIEAAPGAAHALPEADMSFDGFALEAPDGTTLSLPAFIEATSTDSLVVLRHGRLVFEDYANGNRPETPHILMSVTKAVTGLLAGVLQGTGDLDIDAPVSDYVPEIGGTAYRGATIRDLLDMRTGVILGSAQLQAYDAALRGDVGAAGIHPILQTLTPVQRPHGGPFSYISANTDLLGWAIQRATGLAFADLVSDRLWKPMGAEFGADMVTDTEGSPWCSGGLCVAARDFARLGDLLLNRGRRGGREIIPAPWIGDLSQGGDRDAWRQGEWGAIFSPISPRMSYRSGWYAAHDEPPLLFAMGAAGQHLFVDHAHGLVIAKLSSQTHLDDPATLLTHRAVVELRRCVLAQAAA